MTSTLAPHAAKTLLDMKTRYDQRQANSAQPRNLEAFLQKQDAGAGVVRVEDFKAAWSTGGVVMGPSQLMDMQGAYGAGKGLIAYPNVLADLDSVTSAASASAVMATKMGLVTAHHVGYTETGNVSPGAGGSLTISLKTQGGHTSTLMRTSKGVPIQMATNPTTSSTYNSTTIVNSSVTQRNKSMHPASASGIIARLNAMAAAPHSELVQLIQEYDPQATGCMTLDAFLTVCARAGVTIKPDELDALRNAGTLRRPYANAPELMDFSAFMML